jgi:diketogulonate reductase-like aldo/keto reductase
LLEIIRFSQERIDAGHTYPPPRIPDVLQAYADPLHPAEELRRICAEHGIEFVSYSTLGTQHRNVGQNPVLTSPIVVQLAEKHSRSVAEVVLSWALLTNMSVIPRSSKKHHIAELARLLDNPTFLDENDLEAIDSMSHEDLSEL